MSRHPVKILHFFRTKQSWVQGLQQGVSTSMNIVCMINHGKFGLNPSGMYLDINQYELNTT